MKSDPANSIRRRTLHLPPSRGPGSGKDAWVRIGAELADGNGALWEIVDRQSRLIEHLTAEVARLEKRIADRKPKGGRPKLEDRRADAIRADLDAGYSQRAAAVRNGVSAMTVSRLARS